MKKVNYLNNRDLLAEIHKSKNTFCCFSHPDFHQYDIILSSINEIDHNTIIQAKVNQAKRLTNKKFEQEKEKNPAIKIAECEVSPDTINTNQLIFRIMTYDHIPEDKTRKSPPKKVSDTKVKTNFPPFQHWKYDENNKLVCVGKSHWKGDLDNGKFSKKHGMATNKLAHMWMKLCERYATKSNVRGYSYNDEMQGQAILQLTQVGLQFDESKSNNPFAYYTQTVKNSFVRIINTEKTNQKIRDDILELNNLNPSYTRQSENDWSMMSNRQASNEEH